MAGELQTSFQAARTVYFLIRNAIGQIWNTSSSSMVSYATASYSSFTISGVEQGTASGYYIGTFPATIVPGTYSVTAKQQTGGSVSETDPTIAVGNVEWNGSVLAPLSDTATSGQIGQFLPIKAYRGAMIASFPFKLVSSVDHVTPVTSGICSGQISRNGGTFGALQSGIFTEIGLGFYHTTLTSGDMLANTVALVFTATGVSGGTSDPRDFTMVLQRTSGQPA